MPVYLRHTTLASPRACARRMWVRGPVAKQQRDHLREKPRQLNRPGVIVIASRFDRFFAVACVRRQPDDGNVLEIRVRLQAPGRLPTVHQNQIRRFGPGQLDPHFSVDGHQHFVTSAFEPARQHVAVHFVVFNNEDCGHRVQSATLRCEATPVCAIEDTLPAGCQLPLSRRNCRIEANTVAGSSVHDACAAPPSARRTSSTGSAATAGRAADMTRIKKTFFIDRITPAPPPTRRPASRRASPGLRGSTC
jgi:hypothetical protein